MMRLTIQNHDRNSAGYTYIYPVVSRRAGGVSVGINLNPNNACNWACRYCQVPNLTRGRAPPIDLAQLERELSALLGQIVHGDWMAQHVPEPVRVLRDIAFSGNGEPTSAEAFAQAVARAGQVLRAFNLPEVKLRLITNGSLMLKQNVQAGVRAMSALNGEVWFKLDRATPSGMAQINQIHDQMAAVKKRLLACAGLCPTWVQTCWFALDGQAPDAVERAAYLAFLAEVAPRIQGVHLYGLARQSMQPDSARQAALPLAALEDLARQIRNLGIDVTVNA